MPAPARRKLVAGNWKMNPGSLAKARELAQGVRDAVAHDGVVEVVVVPPMPFVAAVGEVVAGSALALGAQNMHPEAGGAFTGEAAASMWRDLGVRYVLCGHSERRQLFGESSELVGAKVAAAHAAGLTPILCVGETLAEREADETEAVVAAQLDAGLHGLDAATVVATVIAYEPVWAIGTGRNATPAQAQAVHHFIREHLRPRLDEGVASLRILYGGSVKPANAGELMAEPDVDGALVGGACLDAPGFAAIIAAATSATSRAADPAHPR